MNTYTVGINVFPLRPGKNGGVETLVVDMVERLCNKHSPYRYVLFASQENQGLFSDEHSSLKKIVMDIPVDDYKRYEKRFRNIIESQQLEFIHYPLTTIFPLDLDIPCLLSVMDIQHEYFPEFFTKDEWNLRDRTYSASVMKAQKIIAISNHTKSCLVKRYGINSDSIEVVYPLCGEEFFQDCREIECIKAKQAYGLPSRYIIYPAGTWPHKNHAKLLRTLYNLKKKGIHIPLVLIGISDKYENSVLKLIAELNLKDQVFKIGYVPRKWVKPLIGGAVFLVFPSLFEGFGIPVLEAMALGVPVACANNTSLPEIGGDAVVYFDATDSESICRAMELLWNDQEKRSECSQLGRKRAMHFYEHETINCVLNVYDRMVYV